MKSEINRKEINKHETEQMNRSCAWFGRHYPGSYIKNIMVHPGRNLASAAAFTHEVEVMRESELRHFVGKVRDFFKSFESQNFRDLSPANIQQLIDGHGLSVPSILSNYTKEIRDQR